MKRKPPYVLSHFPAANGWRYSWIDAEGERHESRDYETRREARIESKKHDDLFEKGRAGQE